MPETEKLIEILLVEDNECDVELTRHLFEKAKVRNRLHVVANGEEALDFVYHRGAHSGSVDPDIIFLDMNLPRKSGRDVIDTLRNDPAKKDLPVIALSGSGPEGGDVETCAGQADFYLTKPLTIPSLINAFQTLEEFWLELVTLSPADEEQRKKKKAS